MTTSRRLARLPLLLIGLAALAALVLIPLIVHAQSQEVTATAAATGANPPAKPTSLQASAVHDSVTLTWTASTDQTVTHYAVLRRNPGTDASQVFHVIESNAGPETSYSDGTVSASTTYIYRVKAVSPTGVSQWSGYVKAETPAAPDSTLEPTPTPTPTPTPSPEPVSTPAPEDLRPTGLTVSLVENKVTLSWTAPAEDAGSVDGYEIVRRRPMEGESTLATLVADTESTATTYTDATANEPGVRYVYRIKALRGDDVSLWSNYDRIDLPSDYVPDPTPTPEPESTSDDQAPTGLSAALTDGGGVTLSWTAPSDDAGSVTGYEVLRAVGEGEMATLVADTASTTTSYSDATATDAGETYAYQVKAIRGEDRSEASGQAQVQLPHDPADLAPTGLTAVILIASVVGEEGSTISVRLSWTAPAEDADSVTGYEVLRAVGDGEIATLVDDTGSTATAYTDTTATEAGETYAYKVKAIRGEDRSQASGQAGVQLPHDAVDLAPSDLTAEAVDGGGVDLSWTAPAEDAGGVTGYEVLRAVGEGDMATLVADTASTDTTYTDATATGEGETFAYRVKAIRGQARSQASNRVSLVPVEPPATPENLKPTNLTFEIREDGVTLAWDAPAADADSVTGYRVMRRRPNQGENEWLVWKWDTGSTETTYWDGYARTHGEFYMYRVRALRGDDHSKMSNRVDVRRPQATPQTTAWAPSNLQAQMYFEVALGEEGVTEKVKLTWDAPAEGTEWVRGYEVQRATCDGGFTTLVADTGSTDTAYTDAGVEAGESYTYRARARRPQGLSLTSNTWTILLPGGNGESDCAGNLQVGGTLEFVPEIYQLSTHDTEVVLVKNTGQTSTTFSNQLTSDNPKRAVQITTGANRYELSSIGVYFKRIDNTGTAGSHLTVTLNAVANNGNPGAALCTLTDPSTFSTGVLAFDAPATCPELEASTSYFVVIERVTHTTDVISVGTTVSNNEDTGGAAEWLIGNIGYRFSLSASTWATFSDSLQIEVRGVVRSIVDPSTQEFTTLAEGNDRPHGIWSDGTTMWVSQRHNPVAQTGGPAKIFAYDMATKAHKPTEDFDTLVAAGNDVPVGIWSDGTTMFVIDEQDRTIYAYDMATKQRDTDKEVWENRVFASGYSKSLIVGLRHHIGSFTETYQYYGSWSSDYFRPAIRGVVLRNGRLYLHMRPGLSSSSVVSHFRTRQEFVLEVGGDSFHSDDATASIDEDKGVSTHSWPAGSLTWTAEEELSVRLKTAPVPDGLTANERAQYLANRKLAPDVSLISGTMTVGEAVQTNLPEGSLGLWSDGDIVWVSHIPSVCCAEASLKAWELDTGVRLRGRDFTGFHSIGNNQPWGVWADGSDMFVSDMADGKVYAHWRIFEQPNPGRDIQLAPLQRASDLGRGPRGIWSDGTTMWVADRGTGSIQAYVLPPVQSPLTFRNRVLVRGTGDTAMVKVDLRGLPFNGVRKSVSISVGHTGYTIYAHPDAQTALFLLQGLEPETQYTVVSRFDNDGFRSRLGRTIFRTDYHPRLDDIEVSGLTHNEATLTVSLVGADVNKKAYPNLWLSSDRTEPNYTFYLRHKASDETEWAEPVELTFSDSTADARLTGLDPGTAYDVEVGEHPTFMPPRTTVASYTGTLTVGDEGSGAEIWGMDLTEYYGDPYGSMSPDPTFEVRGTTRSVTSLYAHPYGGPDFDQPALYLEFDTGLAGSNIEFTLTVDGTEYHSADGSRDGFGSSTGWEWLMGPNWSEDDMVTVQLDFMATAEEFREGSRLEWSFTTPPLPPTLAFDAEMTVGTDSANAFAGFSDETGSLSATTFEVGGVEYTVKQVGIATAAPAAWAFLVDPALPFDSFTLTLGSTELSSSSATHNDAITGRQYVWSATNPNWGEGATVDVKLDIGLIDICDRSSAVAHAIKAATPSFDYCRMTSVLDLDDVTELDLPNGKGTGLKAGDFEGLSGLTHLNLSRYNLGGLRPQLPVGVFDGLDSLTHLDISHTGLQNLNRAVFEGLDNLVELDLSDTSLQRGTVPVGVFDGLDNLEVLRLTNEAEHYEGSFSSLHDDLFRVLGNLRELDVRPSTPHLAAPRSLMPLTSLETYNGRSYTRPVDPPKNLTATMEDFPGDSSRKKVTLTWEAPDGVSGITGYRILRTDTGHPLKVIRRTGSTTAYDYDYSRYAYDVATVGSSTFTYVHGASDGLKAGSDGEFTFTYYVAAITADGDSFPVKVFVSP